MLGLWPYCELDKKKKKDRATLEDAGKSPRAASVLLKKKKDVREVQGKWIRYWTGLRLFGKKKNTGSLGAYTHTLATWVSLP